LFEEDLELGWSQFYESLFGSHYLRLESKNLFVILKINSFFKGGQKLCPNLLIKKKRIAQLIDGKPDENRYNNTKNSPKSTYRQDNQQSLSTYNRHKLRTQRAPHHKEDQLNEPANSTGDHQSSSRGNFQEKTLFFFFAPERLLHPFDHVLRCQVSRTTLLQREPPS
jgi:hypothetical protein